MSLQVSVASVSLTTAIVGTQFPTDVGYEPKAALLFWNGRLNTGSGDASLRRGIGFVGAGQNRCAMSSELHAATVGEADRGMRNDACIGVILPGTSDPQTLEGRASGVLTSTGLTVTIDDAFVTGLTAGMVLFGGSDITDVAVGDGTAPLSAGLGTAISLPFTPDVIFLATVGGVAMNSIGNDSVLGIGASDRDLNQWAHCSWSDDGPTTMDTWKYQRSGECLAASAGATGLAFRAAMASMSEGFQLNWLEVDGVNAAPYIYLAIRGGRWKVGNFLTQANTSEFHVDVGFQPRVFFVVSACAPESAVDTPVAQNELSIGAIQEIDGGAACCYSQSLDNVGTSECFSECQAGSTVDGVPMYMNYTTVATPARNASLFLISSFRTGVALQSQLVADDAQNFVGYVALADLLDRVEGIALAAPDDLGRIYAGAPVRYVDRFNVEYVGFLDQASASYGDTIALIYTKRFIDASYLPGAESLTESTVPHGSTVGTGPYWVFF